MFNSSIAIFSIGCTNPDPICKGVHALCFTHAGQLWCHDKIGSSMLARVDSGWPQEAVGSSDLYSFVDTREMDITMYCGDVERTCALIFRVQKCA